MCTQPITFNRLSRLGEKEQVTVPCGKCAECLKHKQREFAALAVLEAHNASSLHFLTLTYRNDCCPLAKSDLSVERHTYEFVPDSERLDYFPDIVVKDKSLGHLVVGDYQITPSLRREDVRLWLKRCRIGWKRLGHQTPSFVYAAFGEYGTHTFRPHYHLEILNASDDFINYICEQWRKDFGFVDCRKIPRVNKDGSNGFLRVSLYISKYIAKPKKYFPFLSDGLAEPPRRFSSRNFGLKTIPVSRLKDYYLCKDLSHLDQTERLLRIASRSKSINIEGSVFPFPRRLREKVFYYPVKIQSYDFEKGKAVYSTRLVRREVSRLAMEAARVRDSENIARELRENSEANPNVPIYILAKKISDSSNAFVEDRATIAEKNLLISLKKEKV